ncbi:MAG: 4-(cytidine 5'-diphospho)-2-C-methyl-D-erythritol kinase, partial [Ginsengibacter sp.]
MIAFPNCKINLGLHILRKKEDGYHDLETFFFPVPIHDALEILPSESGKTKMISSGIDTGEAENNICLKAYCLLRKDFPQLPEVTIHLHKAIPLGSGLGGGSSDGVATLQLLNKKFNLNISEELLCGYALQLGSDCPFFVLNKPAVALGRGETLTPVDFALTHYKIVIVNPGIHVSTTEAFKDIIPAVPSKSIKEIIHQPISTWKRE